MSEIESQIPPWGRQAPSAKWPKAVPAESVWDLLQETLAGAGTAEGIEWSTRPFSRRWRLQRLGWAGLSEVLTEVIDLRTWGYALTDDSEGELDPCRLSQALAALRRDESGQVSWFVAASGRFLLEWHPDSGRLSLEFVRVSNTRMLARLRAREAEWKAPDVHAQLRRAHAQLREAFGPPAP
jgi:hypothetical protein